MHKQKISARKHERSECVSALERRAEKSHGKWLSPVTTPDFDLDIMLGLVACSEYKGSKMLTHPRLTKVSNISSP
ncbi:MULTISPECIES: hypothetical protein [Rhizobium/Agrobacterium group]|uniref:Uncharacterized protein n=1 Tax=Agrobacterium vitis TaxID=373 RepID=A0ABD6HE19_AGRVI|nr:MULTISPECIES: hypothetical protein [Rhizobium/Agrobacterium group]MCF1448277.1 hypothetical protein [Allorhizobium ampelinum]MUO30286.1 hypothetical protein [Agrobacterium vitis]MUO44588.1 hypothetical protein [Agrobacterium vitis]MUP12263.1 hypothetical protein [Agrobacterium vitis]